MKMRMLLLTLCMLGMAAGYAQTTTRELWMWKDANGVTHYSDTPEPGAIKIQIQQASPTAPRAPRPASASARTSAATPAVRYRVEITSPANGASFFGADAAVPVHIAITPHPNNDERLALYQDGKLVEGAPGQEDYTLSNLERGQHTLTALLLEVKGAELARSEAVVFNVQQPSINNPANVGPALKPTPR